MLSTILVATDGSPAAERAIDWAAQLSIHFDARLVVLHVVTERDMIGYREDFPEYARMERIAVADAVESVVGDTAEEGEKRARAQGALWVTAETRYGEAASVIVDHARRCDAQLIVMGRRGLSPLAQVAVGSVSGKVSQQSGHACLLVR